MYCHVSRTLISKINFTTQVSGQHLVRKCTVPLQIYNHTKTPCISAIYEKDEKLNGKIQYQFVTGKKKENLLGKNSDKWWSDMFDFQAGFEV